MTIIPDPSNEGEKKVVDVAKISPMLRPRLTLQEIAKLKDACNKGASFYIVATAPLKEMMVRGEPYIIAKLNPFLTKTLLEGNGIRVDSKMIIDWLSDKLDTANSLILNYCEIRVEGTNMAITPDVNKVGTSTDLIEREED